MLFEAPDKKEPRSDAVLCVLNNERAEAFLCATICCPRKAASKEEHEQRMPTQARHATSEVICQEP